MTLRAAIIGYGLSGRVFHRPLLVAAGFELAGIGVREPEHRDPADGVVFRTVEDVVSDPSIDLVVITSPNNLHLEHGLRAIGAGKHVVIEKPLAVRGRDARTLRDAATRSGKVVTVFHSRRWDGDYLTLRGLVEAGAVGDWQILESRWSMNKPVAQRRWKDSDEHGGGLLNDLMPHLVDQALQLFGKPDRAATDRTTQRIGGVGDDYVCITMAYGRKRVVLAADCFGMRPQTRFRLAGTEGEYAVEGMDGQEAQLRAGILPTDPAFGAATANRSSTLTDVAGERRDIPILNGRYGDFYKILARAIQTGEPPPVLVEEAVDVVDLIETLREAGAWTPANLTQTTTNMRGDNQCV